MLFCLYAPVPAGKALTSGGRPCLPERLRREACELGRVRRTVRGGDDRAQLHSAVALLAISILFSILMDITCAFEFGPGLVDAQISLNSG